MRDKLLQKWGKSMQSACRAGLFGASFVPAVYTIKGPRAGVLEIDAGLRSAGMLKVLRQQDRATLRQFVPWDFVGDPNAFMRGRRVRVEAGWPDSLAESMIRLDTLSTRPEDPGKWVLGRNEYGSTIVLSLSDRTPHFLVSGTTGSGKSVALRSAALQLARHPDTELVLIDGKHGESLRDVAPLGIGPLAVETPDVRAALSWVYRRMVELYQLPSAARRSRHLAVLIDEFQKFADDPAITHLMGRIAEQGRAANVHLIMATQHPTVDAFGEKTTRRNLVGRVAFLVNDWDASKVAIGGREPRADRLLGTGDAYALAPGTWHRVQVAYVDELNMSHLPRSPQRLEAWPEYVAEDLGQEPPKRPLPTAQEIAYSLLSAIRGEGRPKLRARFGNTPPGADRARWLLQLGRGAWGIMRESGELSDCLTASPTPLPHPLTGGPKG